MTANRYAAVENQLLRTVLLMCGPGDRMRGIREAIEMYLAEQEDFTLRNGEPEGGGVTPKKERFDNAKARG